jgi:ribosome biogenesis GTPase
MLNFYGWSPALQADFAPFTAQNFSPARVIAQHRDLWKLITAQGDADGRLTGRFFHDATLARPVVGDWVAIDNHGLIHDVLARRSVFARRAAGGIGAQTLCANIDAALLVMALNRDFNVRRLERYLIATKESGADAIIVLTKADIAENIDAAHQALDAINAKAPRHVVSSLTGDGVADLREALTPLHTFALLGSSGAGKSTLLNAIAGHDLMTTGAVRADDDRGRHTTRHRELFRLPHGALVIDTPGMRELGLIADEDALDASFNDVAALSASCRFSDCTHGNEPGCAVQAGLESGALTHERWRAFQKLQREMRFEARKEDMSLAAADKQKWKQIHQNQRARSKARARWREED